MIPSQSISQIVDRLFEHHLGAGFAAERQTLAAAFGEPREIAAGADVRGHGSVGDAIHLVLDGWAGRYKLLEDGRRQIAFVHLPGDFCDLDALAFDRLHYGVTALARCTVAAVRREALRALIAAHPRLCELVVRLLAAENAIMTENVVSLGRRSARERTAHLMCEFHHRLKVTGRATDAQFDAPLTQDILADVLGLTPVHVNRVLQGLRRDGLITAQARQVRILAGDALARIASFKPGYLEGASIN